MLQDLTCRSDQCARLLGRFTGEPGTRYCPECAARLGGIVKWREPFKAKSDWWRIDGGNMRATHRGSAS